MTQAAGFDVTVGPAPGYLAVPTGTGPWPGVVVIHESWGLNTDIRASTRRLGFAGYLALAPDLYEGRSFVRCFRGVFRQLHAGSGARDLMGAGPPRRLEAALTTLDVPHDVKVYPSAGHSFMSPKPSWLTPLARLARLDFKPEAAEDSWHRIFAFFGEHLHG